MKLELTPTSCTPGGIGHFLALEFAAKGRIPCTS
jgi:1-acylglycerone phosphate reductase